MKFLKEVNTETVKYKAKGQGIDVAIEKVGIMMIVMATSAHTIIITMTTSPLGCSISDTCMEFGLV